VREQPWQHRPRDRRPSAQAGHADTALVREQPKPGETDARVAIVVGDATDQ